MTVAGTSAEESVEVLPRSSMLPVEGSEKPLDCHLCIACVVDMAPHHVFAPRNTSCCDLVNLSFPASPTVIVPSKPVATTQQKLVPIVLLLS